MSPARLAETCRGRRTAAHSTWRTTADRSSGRRVGGIDVRRTQPTARVSRVSTHARIRTTHREFGVGDRARDRAITCDGNACSIPDWKRATCTDVCPRAAQCRSRKRSRDNRRYEPNPEKTDETRPWHRPGKRASKVIEKLTHDESRSPAHPLGSTRPMKRSRSLTSADHDRLARAVNHALTGLHPGRRRSAPTLR